MSDGTVRRGSFRLVRTGPSTIEVTGSEVVGSAEGSLNLRTLRLLSTIRLESGNPLSDVEFDQRMQLQPDGRTLTNGSRFGKFGLTVPRIEERFVELREGRRRR